MYKSFKERSLSFNFVPNTFFFSCRNIIYDLIIDIIFNLQDDSDGEGGMDETYYSKQIEAQVVRKKHLHQKLEVATERYDEELKKRMDARAAAKIDLYNNWRRAEEQKGKACDETSRKLVKKMIDNVKTLPTDPITESMCMVLGNFDGIYIAAPPVAALAASSTF